jgi:nocardicin N-oxygenase
MTALTFPPPAAPSAMEPSPLFAQLRREQPVAQVRLPTGDHAWLVTRYHDNRQVLSDPRFSRAAAAAAGAPRLRAIPLERDSITTLDPPEHTRLRRAVLPYFTAARVESSAERIRQISADLLADVFSGEGPADLAGQFATPLAMTVICDVLGVPAGDRAEFQAVTTDYLGLGAAGPASTLAAAERLKGYFDELTASRQRSPGSDTLSLLAADGRLTSAELVTLGTTLLTAGYQTVANQLGISILALLGHPAQVAGLSGPASVRTAAEELLRYAPLSVSGGTIRVALADVLVGGTLIEAGEAVLPATTSANRDELVFAAPHQLDLSRTPNPHLAFGHGIHRCLGDHLARLQLRTAIGVLLPRLPRLRLAVAADDIPWRNQAMVRGPLQIPVVPR